MVHLVKMPYYLDSWIYKLHIMSIQRYFLIPSISNRDPPAQNNRQEDDETNGKCGLNRKSNISKDSKKEDKGCGNSEGNLIRHLVDY